MEVFHGEERKEQNESVLECGLLMDWQVHQCVPSSKVKIEVRVSYPQRFCLYLGRWIFNLQVIDKEFKIEDKER